MRQRPGTPDGWRQGGSGAQVGSPVRLCCAAAVSLAYARAPVLQSRQLCTDAKSWVYAMQGAARLMKGRG